MRNLGHCDLAIAVENVLFDLLRVMIGELRLPKSDLLTKHRPEPFSVLDMVRFANYF